MIEAKEFWKYLCEELDYRFFAGVACPGLSPLYKKMSSKFMHYVPAVNERVGLGLVSGAYMSGLKGALLMDMKFVYDITSTIEFNVENRIPLLVIGYSGSDESILTYDLPVGYISDETFATDVSRVSQRSEKEKVPGVIIIEKGAL